PAHQVEELLEAVAGGEKQAEQCRQGESDCAVERESRDLGPRDRCECASRHGERETRLGRSLDDVPTAPEYEDQEGRVEEVPHPDRRRVDRLRVQGGPGLADARDARRGRGRKRHTDNDALEHARPSVLATHLSPTSAPTATRREPGWVGDPSGGVAWPPLFRAFQATIDHSAIARTASVATVAAAAPRQEKAGIKQRLSTMFM